MVGGSHRAARVSPSLAISNLSYFGSVVTVVSLPESEDKASASSSGCTVSPLTSRVLETSASASDSTSGSH